MNAEGSEPIRGCVSSWRLLSIRSPARLLNKIPGPNEHDESNDVVLTSQVV